MGTEEDAFWDLEKYRPARPASRPSLRPFAPDAETAEVTVPPPPSAPARPPREREIGPALSDSSGTVTVYQPAENCLLSEVRIVRRAGGYNFYGQFRRDAAACLHEIGTPCAYVPFFSYIPQYAQLNDAQRNWYFYWRSRVRAGEYPETCESYFFLYVYEIINLPDLIPPAEGVLALCRVWEAYRRALPRIDKYMAEWVCDYCLTHRLPCPNEALRGFLPAVLSCATLREFYLGGIGDQSGAGAETALAFFSDYAFRDSRYATGEWLPLYEKHIPAALAPILKNALSATRGPADGALSRTAHEAFCGSLCSYGVKCRLEITYIALSDAAPLRAEITAAVKYAENKLRAMAGLKSRLSVPPFPPAYRAAIDTYFARLTAEKAAAAPKPAYESLYDAPARSTDPAAARRIERESWGITDILVSDVEEEPAAPPAVSPVAPPVPSPTVLPRAETAPVPPAEGRPAAGPELTDDERAYLRALREGNAAAWLRSFSGMAEELAASVNEKSTAYFGDIVLAPADDGDGYALIPDYVEEVDTWIK